MSSNGNRFSNVDFSFISRVYVACVISLSEPLRLDGVQVLLVGRYQRVVFTMVVIENNTELTKIEF